MRRTGRNIRRTAAAAAAVLLAAAAAFPAFAEGPEFSRTEEEWALLRDNTLGYEEIPDLIHEYNATVQNNRADYLDFLKDYGTGSMSVSDKYRDLAQDLLDQMTGEDSAGAMMQDLNLQIQADNMLQQADNNLEDNVTYLIGYEQAEKTLVASAQSQMISLERLKTERQQYETAIRTADEALALASLKLQAGTGTQLGVLDAQEARRNAEDKLTDLDRRIQSTKESLIILMGWQYNAEPEILPVPAPDINRIAAMDPAADLQAALDNNYTLKLNRHKLEKANSTLLYENLQTTIANNERKVGNALNSAYRNVLGAKLSYDQALSKLQLEQQNLSVASAKRNAGMITAADLNKQLAAVESAEIAVRTSSLDLFSAMETYDWTVKGLANAN